MNEAPIARIVEADVNSLPFTAAHSILSLPRRAASVTSIAVLPGVGEDIRLQTAIKLWESDKRFTRLFVAGTTEQEQKTSTITIEGLSRQPYNLHKTEGVITQVSADHTRAQTDWLIDRIQEEKVKSVVLCVSHWHMTRAYMALLKSLLNAGVRIPVIPYAIGTPPDALVPEIGRSVQDLSAGEAQRISTYSANGQIANEAELRDYLQWLWDNYLTQS